METPDLNAPVSNEPAVVAEMIVAVQYGSPGPDPGTKEANEDGSEAVEGYERKTAESAGLSSDMPESTEQLRDIGEASFGPPPPAPEAVLEAIIGPDDRVRITNTTVFPYRAIASLLITAADNSRWIGTAWFISPRTLITAGHCVYIKNSGVPGRDGWVKSITVIPGRDASKRPFGSVTSSSFRSVTGWTNNGSENFDYGAIIIPTPLGNTVGFFGFGVYGDADLLTVTANISGYPGDKPAGEHHFHARKVTSVGPQKVFYDVDTAGGQSGAPVWRVVGGQRIAIAIHAYGGTTANSGTRINSTVNGNLMAWKV